MDKKPDPLAPATLHELADMHIAVTGKYLHEVAAKLEACDLERRTYSDAMAALQSKLDEVRKVVWADLPTGGFAEQLFTLRQMMEPPK